MKRLFEGVERFSQHNFVKNKSLFETLHNSQSPHTLFITCCDSRVIPSLITDTYPGELFVIRNVANIVPPFEQAEEHLSTASSIEYAVKILEVANIVVCGHSNCGGCKALTTDDASLHEIPYTKDWIELANPAKERAHLQAVPCDEENISMLIEQENIILQIEHLLTYPHIKERVAASTLNIFGWYYDIGSGSVYNYNVLKKAFDKIG
jgi:carbonic anhydrase